MNHQPANNVGRVNALRYDSSILLNTVECNGIFKLSNSRNRFARFQKIPGSLRTFFLTLAFILPLHLIAGTNNWLGNTSADWNNASNWSGGIPDAASDVYFYSGSAFYPSLTSGSYTIHRLTINAGSTFSFSGTSLTVKGGNIYVYGTFNHSAGNVSSDNDFKVYSGGIYNQSGGLLHLDDVITSTPTKGLVIAAGGLLNQTGGIIEIRDYYSSPGTFNQNGATASLRIYRDFRPGAGSIFNSSEGTVQFYGTASTKANFAAGTRQFDNIIVEAGAKPLFDRVFNSTLPISGSYTNNNSAQNLSANATFIFNGTENQTVYSASTGTNATFGNLVVDKPSGAVILSSNAYVVGNTTITSGILDLSVYISNRKAAGGILSVEANGVMRLAATSGGQTGSNFPLNFSTINLASTSTVVYYGGNQTIFSKTYGHLSLTGTTGTVVKTMPSTALTVLGNLTSSIGTASSVSYTAASIFTVSGDVNIGSGTTFGAASYAHSFAGNLANEGTLTGTTSTITMTGANKIISGNGTYNCNNLTITGTGVSATAALIGVAGNLATTGTGTFTQNAGTLTMSGTGKTISGNEISLNNLTVSGTATSTSALVVSGNLAINTSASYIMSSGLLTMTGDLKTISNSGTLTISSLGIDGTVTTASSFTITSLLDVSGSITASSGTVTFTGTSTLLGEANLFNVTQNGTSLQLSTDAVLGIAGLYTVTSGTLNVTSTTPNTVHYNGASAQNITAGTFHHLWVSGGAKTATGALNINGNLAIHTSSLLAAGTFTHIIKGNFTNNGTFSAGTGTVQFTGTTDALVSGATTFNNITVNKSTASTAVTLQNNISVGTINMTLGTVKTGANTLTITTTRTGAGIILGNILRSHAFTTGIAYEFEGQNNTINFSSVTGVTSVLVKVSLGTVSDFPNGSAINRLYDISIPAGSFNATLRLHYEDAELNGNTEASMNMFRYNGLWNNASKTTNNTTTNFVELAGLTDVSMKWTLSDAADQIVRWNGSVSNNWATAANWTVISGSPALPPTSNVIVQIGYAAYTNAPAISTAAVAKSISFGSVMPSVLTLNSGGSLAVTGNIGGSWAGAATHTINVNSQTITVNGDVILSDGTTGRAINLNVTAGTVNVLGSLTQSGSANIVFSGAGNINVGADYLYTGGTFTGGTGTVTYNGNTNQNVAPVSYNNLTISKSAGQASINSATSVGGNVLISSGQLLLNAAPTVGGNLTIASGATLSSNSVNTSVAGNWSNSGTFNTSNGSVTLNGTGAQTVSASNFNNLVINKTTGTATLTGNATIAGNLTLTSGTLDLSTFTANRSTAGGTLSLASGTNLLLAGANNFPANYSTNTLNGASTVTYNGAIAQTIASKAYGNLTISNGGATAKTPAASFTINGNLTISSGSTLAASSFTLSLYGNWSNSGTFTQATSTINMNGTGKTITGTTTFNNITTNGSYTITGSNITTTGLLRVAPDATLNTGAGLLTVNGGLTNNGTLVSTGTTTFSGTVSQPVQFSTTTQTSFNIVNFNGTVAPAFSSTSSPTMATLNVTNTAGISPSTGWNITNACTIATGSAFNGGTQTHKFYGSFTNNGTVTSSGELSFLPSSAQTIQLKGTTFTSTGIVRFGGNGAIGVNGIPNTLTHVVIDNSAGVTPASNWTLAGGFTINANKIFNAGSYSYTVAGDFQSDGTLNPGTSTFTLSGTGMSLSGSSTTTFYDLVITGTIAATADYNVARNFTNNGTYDGTAGMVIFTGNLASSLTGSATTLAVAQVGVQKATGVAVTLSKSISTVANLDVMSGTFDQSTFTVTQDAVDGGELWVADNATYRIAGTNTLPIFSLYQLDSLSTFEYYGTTQSISASTAYGNLVLSSTGTKTAAGALNIRGNFNLSNATFVGGSYVDTLSGNWIMTSGTFTNTGTTILFNGADNQYVNSTGAFNHIKLNKFSGAVVLSANATVNGTLTFLAGNVVTNTNTLILSSTGSIAGAGQTTGWVNGLLQRHYASAAGGTFDVGGPVYYSPLTISFASVTTVGSLIASATGTAHPGISTSSMSTKAINRYWSISKPATGAIAYTTATIRFNWNVADNYASLVPSSLIVGNFNASSWNYPAVSGTSALTQVTITGIGTLGDFTAGETPGIGNNKLSYTSGTSGVICATVNENNNAVLTAPAGTIFTTVDFASFGTPTGTCSSFVLSNCNASNSQSVSETYLLGVTSATIPATNAVFGDACVGTSKRLYVQAAYTQPICSGTAPGVITGATPTGGTGFYTYLWEKSTTGPNTGYSAASGTNTAKDYTPGVLTQTTWFRRTVYSGALTDTKVIMVKVTPLPTASISYAGSPFCANSGTASVTLTGTTGGIYSSTSGLTINAATGVITLALSTPGTYTVTYTIAAANGCSQVVATTNVTVTAVPSATISYAGSPYLSTGGTATVTRTGTSGGTYTSAAGLSINSSTGSVDLAASTMGTYTVTYTVAAAGGCAVYTTTAGITIANTITWTGGQSTDWSLAVNWNGGIPGISNDVIIPTGLGRYPVISAAATAATKNITLQTGSRVTIIGTLQVGGSITAPSASMYADSATIEFKGSATQTMPAGVVNNELYNLVINNPAGVSLGGELKISNLLSVQNGFLQTNDFLTLRSNPNITARVGVITSPTANPVRGNVTVERYIAGRRKYRLITSPVTSSTASVLTAGEVSKSIWGNWQNAGVATSGIGTIITGGTTADGFDQGTTNASLYTYNDVTKKYVAYTSANGKNTKLTPLKAGVGYYMFVYGDRINSISSTTPNPTTLRQTGTLLTGNQVYNTTSAIPLSGTVGNYSLIGNPFACTIDWKTVTKTNVSKTIWGWDANLSSTGGYVTVTATTLGALISPLSNVIAVSRYVQPGQAFFVQTIAPNPQVLITEADKIDDKQNINSAVFRDTGVNEQPLVALNLLYNNGITTSLLDGALVAFDNAFDNKVNDEDGLKLAGSAEGLGMMVDNNLLSINARKMPALNDTLELNLARLTKTQYTFEIFAKQLDNLGLQPWLYDSYQDKMQVLSITDTNYVNFTVKSTDAASQNPARFKIVFKEYGTLPVHFTSIAAVRKNKEVEVQWNVALETNIDRYEVQRSANGVNFKTISTLPAKGNNNNAQAYKVVDVSALAGANYYQVKAIQKDGLPVTTKVVLVKMEGSSPFVKVFPNPVREGLVNLQMADFPKGVYVVDVFNSNGQKLAETKIDHNRTTGTYEILLDEKLPRGMYYLHIRGEKESYEQSILLQ